MTRFSLGIFALAVVWAGVTAAPAEEIPEGAASVVVYKFHQLQSESAQVDSIQYPHQEVGSIQYPHEEVALSDSIQYPRQEVAPPDSIQDLHHEAAPSDGIQYPRQEAAPTNNAQHPHPSPTFYEEHTSWCSYPEHTHSYGDNYYNTPAYEDKSQYDAYDNYSAHHNSFNNSEHESKPHYAEDSKDNGSSDDTKYERPARKLPIGPNPHNPMAPYLLPAKDTPSYHSYQSSIRKQAILDGIAADLKEAELVPDVLPKSFAPEFELCITFNDKTIEMGQLLSINDTKNEPIIEFDAPPGQIYTVAIVDPDSPSCNRHGYRSFRHFLMANMGSGNDCNGEKLTAYRGPQPTFGSGIHRLAVIVLQQKHFVEFTEQDIPHSRVRFDAIKWGTQHHMKPVAASYFLVQREHAIKMG